MRSQDTTRIHRGIDRRSSSLSSSSSSPDMSAAEEDDILELDSPEAEPIDLIEDEEGDDDLHMPSSPSHKKGLASAAAPAPAPASSSTNTPSKLWKPVEKPREQQLQYQNALPYPVESWQEMDQKLELIVRRLIECVRAKDYDVGFVQWNHRLECWTSLKYPMRRDIRAKLTKLYFELSVLPGMDARLVDIAANMTMSLLENKKRIDITDIQLPWRPIFAILEKELFPKQRKTGLTNVSATLLSLTEFSQRFFPPHEIPAMLETFLPRLSSSLNSILATQAFCSHFLPLSHPQYYLQAVFKLWGAFNSSIWDEQWLDMMERLAIRHLDPAVSDPDIIDELRNAARSRGEYVEEKTRVEDLLSAPSSTSSSSAREEEDVAMEDASATAQPSRAPEWKGIRKDVGIFTDEQFSLIMTKFLRATGVPVGGGSRVGAEGVAATDFATSDASASGSSLTMKRPADKFASFAAIIVHSMAVDAPASGTTPMPSRPASPVTTAKKQQKNYLAGSKALDALAKLVQATEGFFHPSNYGAWAPNLGRFLQNVTWEFHKRTKEEERADCKTPLEWRLTPTVRLEFVKTMRTVALLSMFSRDPMTIANAQAALKLMGYLEPDLIFPALLERSYPALETLLETQRTTACITALSTVSPPLISRSVYPAGAKNLVPLLELCLPGLDVNDPIKTMSTAMFVIQAVTSVMVDDLTRPEIQSAYESEPDGEAESDAPAITVDGEEPKLSKHEEDEVVRISTAGFPEWVSSFFRAVLVVFDSLPEPGKNQRNGGKMEDQMTQTMIAACDFVCSQLSPPLFELALSIVFKEVTSNVRSNSARVVSQLVSCFARSNSAQTLKLFFPLCDEHIRLELEGGASSTRTTSTNNVIESDVSLHWWIGLLTGAITNGGAALLQHKDGLILLLKYMIEYCKSERGYTTSSRILALLLVSLTNVWVKDYRSVNAEEWNSESWKTHHHQRWGRLYEVKDVEMEWHVPSDEEISFALELLREIVEPAMDALEALQRESTQEGFNRSTVWTNDFCRYCNVVRSALSGIPALAWLPTPSVRGAAASDAGDEVPEFIDHMPHCLSGICLTDPSDPRHSFVVNLRERAGHLFHEAVKTLKSSAQDDSIDCVKMLISSIRVLELDYPCIHTHYGDIKKTYDFALTISRTTRNQKLFPRFVWVRRAALYHASRMRLNSFYRKRTPLDDLLIADLCELSLSSYVQIRKAAQKGLDWMISYFDGTRTLIYLRLFEALQPGTDHDVMKGALFVLGSKATQNMAILDWRFTGKYLETMLACSHQERPSVQNLIKQITHDFVIRLAEPSTLKATVDSESLKSAADDLERSITYPEDLDLVARVAGKATGRTDQKNEAYDRLLPILLRIAQAPATHWRYSLTSTRFLRALIRRDQPMRPELAGYMAEQLISDLPNQRAHSMLALTKILHFVKLRTACGGSGEKLLLQQTSNPLRKKVKLDRPLPDDFTEKFIESFSKPLGPDTLLMDKNATGWLVWGDSVEFYEVPPEEASAIMWDPTSAETIVRLRDIIVQPSWWETFANHLAMEKTIDYLAADAITLVKSIFQIFEDAPCELIQPIIDGFIADRADRHKQRAAGELIGGMVRGSKHWPLHKQRKLWDWLGQRLPGIFRGITPETQLAWEMCAEYILTSRDPRRNQPLVDYLTSLTIDAESSEAFNTSKQQDLVGTAMKALGWHFTPWADKYIEMYSQHLDHPYQEVRGAVADNLQSLSELRLHPSYPSVEVFLRECETPEGAKALMHVDTSYEARVDDFGARLKKWRELRQPTAQGTQTYDKAALTILSWLWTSMSDFRIATAYPFITKLLPEIFHMQEILDNDELKGTAGRVLIAAACLPYPIEMTRPLMTQFLDLLRNSPSWRIRLDVLGPLQVYYFHNIFNLDHELVAELLEALCDLLRDPKIEVREAAAKTLSGIVRCSQRSAIMSLSTRFLTVLRATKIPKRRNAAGVEVANYQEALTIAHSAVLGISSLINAFPYEVPPFVPGLLIEMATKHASSPVPISTTVRQTLADFKRSHTDSWTEDQKQFTEDQLVDLHDLLTGSSYYA
ncbi:BQ2448_4005 [Microbotryum intermedium]|uniref:BQ2448_4005 protein n=1 Tax=Microbotryum intermedium TaxID=269621 RepID=A0A238FMQ4_9BASI|nr:BQ2448_4005 [Microbotryum intermedium]